MYAPSPSTGNLPLTDFDAWFLSRQFASKNDPLEGVPLSPWLFAFLRRVDIRNKVGHDLLLALIDSEGMRKVMAQDPHSSEPCATVPPVTSPWRLYHASDLDTLPSVQWLIEGEIPAKSLTVLFGASGSGKSFVALDYAIRVAQSVPVVYVAAEGETGYRDRKNAWIHHHQQKTGALYFAFQVLRMLDPGDVQTFIDALRPLSPGLVILDTLARCMVGGDENSARDMGLFIEACGRMKQQLGATILVVHHTGKNGSSERGSSALRGACDSMIELMNDDGQITLICSKSKDASPFPKRFLRLLPVALAEQRSSCVVTSLDKVIEVKGQPLSENELCILRVLKMETFMMPGARISQLVSVTGLSERTLYRLLDKLIRWGYVEQGKRGEPYKLTEEGFNLKG